MDNFDCYESNDLARLSAGGDDKAFCVLVKRHYGSVICYLAGLGVKYEDAEDVAQDAFLNAHTKLHQFDPSKSFVGWILRIAKNCFIDKTRRDKSKLRQPTIDRAVSPTDKPTPEAVVISNSEKDYIYSKLSAKERLMIELRVFQNMSYSQIAELLDLNEATARVTFHRLISKLRVTLQKEAYENETK